MRRHRRKNQRGRGRRLLWIALLGMTPLLGGGSCESGDRMDQIRQATAPVVVDFFTSLGTLVGEYAAAAIEPLPEESETEATTAPMQ